MRSFLLFVACVFVVDFLVVFIADSFVPGLSGPLTHGIGMPLGALAWTLLRPRKPLRDEPEPMTWAERRQAKKAAR